MKLLNQNPAPALLTGHSPPAQQQSNNRPVAVAQPRFGSLIAITPNSVSQFTTDTLGVWAPKVPITRSKTQFFEDAFLELVEDGAFYFTLPVVGPLLGVTLAKMFSGVNDWRKDAHLQKLATHLELLDDKGVADARKLVGFPMRKISEKLDELVKNKSLTQEAKEKLLKPIVSTKAGALIGTIGVAAGFEFMIQHTKNVITAKGFKTKNFAAVAGLEESKAHTQAGLTDPVEKAKKRGKQVGAFVLGSLGAAALAPMLVKKFALEAAKKTMHVVDCTPGFDISKPILAMIISTGVVSYLDAARDPLEKKETGTRLCIVVPYLLFGKELAGFGMAKLLQSVKKVVVGKASDGKEIKKAIKEIVPFVNANPFKQMINPKSLLDFNVVESDKTLVKKLEENTLIKNLANQSSKELKELAPQIKATIIAERAKLENYSYLVGALGCGLGMNWLIYKQTQERYKNQQAQAKQQATAGDKQTSAANAAQALPPQPSAAFRGNPQLAPRPLPVSPWTQQQWPAQQFASPFAAPRPLEAQLAQ